MSYVQRAKAALVAELEGIGSSVPSKPDLLNMYTLLLLSKGFGVTGEDVHNAWAVRHVAIRGDHHSLIPYADLPAHVQAKDDRYVRAIIRAHEVINGKEKVQ